MMRIFIAGASGAVGQPLVRQLAEAGHEVHGMTRTPAKAARLRELGAEPVVADALDRDAVMAAVRAARPEVVVHQLTAIASMKRNLDASFVLTNRLRTEGTDHLIAAARAAGARRFVAQGFAPWSYKREGGPAKAEDAPLETDPPKHVEQTLAAIRHLEAAVTGAKDLEGIVLRYGGFYGPGTGLARGGDMLEAVAKGRFPIVGDGGGVWSFVHLDDAASATRARSRARRGRHLQRRRQRSRARQRMAARPRRGGPGQASATRAALVRAARRRRGGSRADDGGARRVEREGAP
jgi:nucleoside-diphosphate-sugar epimerase